MGCHHPVRCWRSGKKNPDTGKFPVSFSLNDAIPQWLMTVPCGKCLGCLKRRSIEWGIRCVHESEYHEESCFLSLTYKPKFYPKDQMLNKKHFQDFMKRLRKRVGVPLRYLHCGEYGSKTFRAHYHALLFGYDFPDKCFYKAGKNGDAVYVSDELNSLWGLGLCVIGNVTYASAQYVAKYINKPVVVNPLLSKTNFVAPYNTSSRRPGLGMPWLYDHWQDVYPLDRVAIEGNVYKPPRAYDKWMELHYPEVMSAVRRVRAKAAFNDMGMSEQDMQNVAAEQKAAFFVSERDYD